MAFYVGFFSTLPCSLYGVLSGCQEVAKVFCVGSFFCSEVVRVLLVAKLFFFLCFLGALLFSY